MRRNRSYITRGIRPSGRSGTLSPLSGGGGGGTPLTFSDNEDELASGFWSVAGDGAMENTTANFVAFDFGVSKQFAADGDWIQVQISAGALTITLDDGTNNVVINSSSGAVQKSGGGFDFLTAANASTLKLTYVSATNRLTYQVGAGAVENITQTFSGGPVSLSFQSSNQGQVVELPTTNIS